ncbi:hypothetical protein A2803_05080 [Candidatus Woesebacteria bacterium RIFCSPHIGHO2_01_FULL_44_21]|uniref:PIN domain-containing protein n=1 Tax=Candidatus Woesebacteria bacterium RIFCSPHIGHO2_01_FULL_44_21 TaxID=1802503 RepID=A0A1F7Z1W0_9BACT|nr:MAG: hypothetical protein A2803_05080 [Candidatus Woesebacteria bacterium RIFCSPHIGHO2_01_FULL_44_21]OGM68891.1 MAG: hypothetical protein A2897_01895 [Candidatus Woesebacteria bacterium RIFCSPLOWO2_01_FULL_44_24b]
MKEYIVDTNILLRFLLRDVEDQYQKASILFKKASEREVRLLIPQIVIFEVEFALKKFYNFEKGNVIDKLESIVSANYLKVEAKEIFLRSLAIYRVRNISFVDSFLKAYSEAQKAGLMSFDRKIG